MLAGRIIADGSKAHSFMPGEVMKQPGSLRKKERCTGSSQERERSRQIDVQQNSYSGDQWNQGTEGSS